MDWRELSELTGRSTGKPGQHGLQSLGQHAHGDRSQDHAHDAGDDAHPRLAQPFRDRRGKAEQEPTERREAHDDDRDLYLAQHGGVLLGRHQNRRYRTRAG